MNQRKALILALAVVAAVPSTASAESFQKFYKAFVPKMVAAFQARDVKFFEDISTPDFTDKGPQGTVDKAKGMAEMKQQFAASKKMACKVKTLSVKASSSKATAVIWMKADMIVTIGKKDHAISMEDTETQNWVKVGPTWKIKSLVEGKPTHVMMDGKPAPASAVGG